MTPETRARLEQLAARWRNADACDAADRGYPEASNTLQVCANELEALLSSLEPPQAQEPTCVFSGNWCMAHNTYALFCKKRRAKSVPPQEEKA